MPMRYGRSSSLRAACGCHLALLRESRARCVGRVCRVWRGYCSDNLHADFQWRGPEISRHQLDILTWWWIAHGSVRALHRPVADDASLSRSLHTRGCGTADQALLLRHGGGAERGDAIGACEDGACFADCFWHRFPYRTAADHTKGVSAFFKSDDLRAVDRENALRLIPRLRNA